MNCDECNGKLTYDIIHDEYYCADCGLVKDGSVSFGYAKDYGPIDYNKIYWPDEDTQSYEKISGLSGTFLEESSLTQPGEGSVNIKRGKDVITHYCSYTGKSYIARPVWWTNPDNPQDKRWYCLACTKADSQDVDFPAKWNKEDRRTAKKLHLRQLSRTIQQYMYERRRKLKFNPDYYHYETVKDGYLRTAVRTALKALQNNPYEIFRKGGRKPGLGADSVTKFCKLNFAHEVGDIKPIKITYNVNTIRKIIEDIKIDSHQTYNILTSI